MPRGRPAAGDVVLPALTVAAMAVPVAVGWWLLAPGGLDAVHPQAPEVDAAQDGVLAVLMLAAGALSAVPALARAARPVARLLGVLAGAGVGAGTAWALGVGLDSLSGPPDGAVLDLRAYGVLLLWPLTTAVLVFSATLSAVLLERRSDPGT